MNNINTTNIMYINHKGMRCNAYLKTIYKTFKEAVNALNNAPYTQDMLPYQTIVKIEIIEDNNKQIIFENKHFRL